MTTFQQALHIFRKDARHLRLEIVVVLFWLLALIFTGVQTWEGLQERGGPSSSSDGPLSVLLPVAWSLLIARAIQTEALPGDRHFWLTRPYSRASLVLSKLLFIGVFVSLPFAFAQAAIVSLSGLPLFSNLGGADMEWFRSSLVLSIGVMIAALVLWRQYHLRRSGNTAFLAAGATLMGIILYLAFPQSAAFAIQSRLIGSPDGQFALRLAAAGPRKAETKTVNRYRQLLALPITVEGATPQDLLIESHSIRFKTLSGITRRSSAEVAFMDQRLLYTTAVDREFFDAAKNSPVSVQIESYLTQFGNARSAEVPLDGTPVYIPGPGQCGVVAGYDRRMFVCRSAFRGPQPFLSDRVARDEEGRRDWRDSYSRFPSTPRIYPVDSRTYDMVGAGELAPAAPERPATFLVREMVAYFRYTMETPNVRLADFAIEEPNEHVGQ